MNIAFWAKSALWNSHELTYPYPFWRLGAHGTQKWKFPSKIDFGPKIHFRMQKLIFVAKMNFGVKMRFCVPMAPMLKNPIDFEPKWRPFWPKVDFGAKSAFWSKKSPLELSRSTIPLNHFRLLARPDPKKWIFAPKIIQISKKAIKNLSRI